MASRVRVESEIVRVNSSPALMETPPPQIPRNDNRRRALSGMDSPRAPQPQEVDWPLEEPDELSPLAPLEDMLEQQHTPDPAPQPRPRDRRRAISNSDSPRAPPINFPANSGVPRLPTTPEPLAPMSDMLDTPRTAARFVKQPLTVNTSSSVCEDAPPSRRKALSGVNSPRAPQVVPLHSVTGDLSDPEELCISPEGPEAEYVCQAESTVPVQAVQSNRNRRAALSGMDSPRAPGQKQKPSQEPMRDSLSPGLKPLEAMLDSPRTSAKHVALAEKWRRPAALTVNLDAEGVPFRRKALSNCDSPRAPRLSLGLCPGDLEDLAYFSDDKSESPLTDSPLPPVSEMLDSPNTQAVFIEQTRAMEQQPRSRPTRRQALTGPDSPRAPTTSVKPITVRAQPAQSMNTGIRVESPPQSPLPPLDAMLDSPGTSLNYISIPGGKKTENTDESSTDSNSEVQFIQQRLGEAEDANTQWAEYCQQLQLQNSSLLQQVSSLQQQNNELQRQILQNFPRARELQTDDYQAALHSEYQDTSRTQSPIVIGMSQEDLLVRRNALSGRDSPRAPPNTSPTNLLWHSPRSAFNSIQSPARGLSFVPSSLQNGTRNQSPNGERSQSQEPSTPENDIRNTSSSPSRPVCVSPLLQRLLNSSPIRNSPPAPFNTQRSEEVGQSAQSDALERLVDALESYQKTAQDPAILSRLQERLDQRNSR